MLMLIIISASLLTTLVQMVIPIVTGLITKYTLPAVIKGLITLLLNAVVAMLDVNAQDNGTAVLSRETLMTALIGFVISVAMYLGIYSKANLTSSKTYGKLLPNFGLGPKRAGTD